jgi:MFS transporter, putative metabolite:H+ symporter
VIGALGVHGSCREGKSVMVSVAARLERLPFSVFHRRLLLMGGLGYCFDAMDLAVIAFVLPVLMTQWSLSSVDIGVLASSSYIGFFVGALSAGFAGDLLGRRRIMMWALGIFCLASLASAFAQSTSTFFALRVLAGIGTGAESAIVAPFLAEFTAKHYRGRFIGALAGFFSFGFLAAAILGYFLVPIASWGWRAAIIVTAMPIVLLLWWRRALPESPRWLESQRRHTEADRILVAIENEIAQSTAKPLPEPAAIGSEADVCEETSALRNFARLWSGSTSRVTVMTWLLWLSITFCYYSFFTWMPTLMIQKGMSISQSFGYSIGIYAAQIPGYYSAAYCNDRIGRRATIVCYMLLACMAALLLALAQSARWYAVAGILLSLFMNGAYAGVYAYTAEVFPTAIRATGAGTASAVGRIGAISAPILVGAMFPIWGFVGVFGTTTGVLCAGAAAVLLLGVSTHNRSLEAITLEDRKLKRQE